VAKVPYKSVSFNALSLSRYFTPRAIVELRRAMPALHTALTSGIVGDYDDVVTGPAAFVLQNLVDGLDRRIEIDRLRIDEVSRVRCQEHTFVSVHALPVGMARSFAFKAKPISVPNPPTIPDDQSFVWWCAQLSMPANESCLPVRDYILVTREKDTNLLFHRVFRYVDAESVWESTTGPVL